MHNLGKQVAGIEMCMDIIVLMSDVRDVRFYYICKSYRCVINPQKKKKNSDIEVILIAFIFTSFFFFFSGKKVIVTCTFSLYIISSLPRYKIGNLDQRPR